MTIDGYRVVAAKTETDLRRVYYRFLTFSGQKTTRPMTDVRHKHWSSHNIEKKIGYPKILARFDMFLAAHRLTEQHLEQGDYMVRFPSGKMRPLRDEVSWEWAMYFVERQMLDGTAKLNELVYVEIGPAEGFKKAGVVIEMEDKTPLEQWNEGKKQEKSEEV